MIFIAFFYARIKQLDLLVEEFFRKVYTIKVIKPL